MRRGRGLAAVLAGSVLLGGASGVASGAGAGPVVGHVGSVTVVASGLQAGPSDALTTDLRITTSGPASDQLDEALAAGGSAVDLYHQQVSVGELSDLASCDGSVPPVGLVDQWLHEGPLLVPGRAYGAVGPATATLTMAATPVATGGTLAVTLYFAHAGQLTLDLPVRRA